MARSRRGLERTNVRDGPPAAASRKIHRRHVIERNVTKKFVRTKMQTPILGCGRMHRECRPPVLHTRVTSLKELSEPVDHFSGYITSLMADTSLKQTKPIAAYDWLREQLSQMLTPEMFTLVLGKSFRCVQSEFPQRFDFRVSDSRILFPYHVQPDELYRRTTVSCPNLFS